MLWHCEVIFWWSSLGIIQISMHFVQVFHMCICMFEDHGNPRRLVFPHAVELVVLNTTRVVRVWGPKVKVNCFETIEVIWTDLRWFEESNFPTNQKDSCFLAWCRWFTFRKWWFPIATCWGSTRRSVPLWHRHPLSAWPMPGTWGELPGKHTWDIVYCRGATLRDYISHTLVDVWWWTYETKLMNQWTAQWIYSMSPSTPKNLPRGYSACWDSAAQNLKPRPQILFMFSINHPTVGVSNVDLYLTLFNYITPRPLSTHRSFWNFISEINTWFSCLGAELRYLGFYIFSLSCLVFCSGPHLIGASYVPPEVLLKQMTPVFETLERIATSAKLPHQPLQCSNMLMWQTQN